ncbi:MAG: hypothetical protein N3F66_14175 [Spirochaetes bacterium]|nr:hypothetical protein [Spirochaetota bacterium]
MLYSHTKMYYIRLVIFIWISLYLACSSGKPKELKEDLPRMKTIQKIAIVVRIPASSPIEYSRYTKTLQAMIAGYRHIKEVVVIPDAASTLTVVESNDDRFFQTSVEGNFLYYKATGIVNSYCFRNKNDLKSIFEKYGCDLLVIYEPYGVVSYGMGFIDYDSVMVILNTELKVVYFDYNHDRKEINEFSTEILWDFLLNEINSRCVTTLTQLGFLK